MSTIRNPVGPQPPQVYWRRRLLVALGIVAVIVVVILIVVRPGSHTPTGANTDTPAAGGTTPSFASTAKPGGACDPTVLTVTAVTDAASYAAGVQPQLSLSITNSGATSCTFDVGTDAQVYTITSGSDLIWSSKDCQTNATPTSQTLEPGKAVSTTPFAWDRTRSSTTTCSATRPAVTAGGASYHLNVAVGAAKSKTSKQFILQ